MSSALVKIKVLSNLGDTVNLCVKIVSPSEYYFHEKKNFALQIIWESAQLFDFTDSPLLKHISADQIADEEWVHENQDKFIKNVKILSTKNYPAKDRLSKMKRLAFEEFRLKHGMPEAEFFVEVTDKKLLKHLKQGVEWESASYDMEA